ncbi:carbohydrate-binding module family 5 protein [Backusella circina FSU 941]|nr:carbohydrate-binding module family 5 protein [Backusella circina FSU 941]
MRFSTLLTGAAGAALFLFETTLASPINLESRSATSNNKVIVGYFPNWLYEDYLPSKIDFSVYTHILYAFALQVSGNTPIWADNGIFDADVEYNFQSLMKAANATGAKVAVSVGGWSGGKTFSPMAASATGRAAFIQWNINFIKKYGTSGVDLDWEYPTSAGAGCNQHSANDITNYLQLLKELRSSLDTNFPSDYKEITMAVHITPWGGDEDVDDVSAFVPYVDRFNVMAFDINGPWNDISGPNAPFKAEPGKGYSKGFVEGIQTWNSAGVPYNKLVGGIPFYGRVQTLTVTSDPTTQYNPAVSPNPPLGDSDDGPWTDPYCAADSQQAAGEWKWKNLRSQGLLTTPTTAASPWVRHFDNITQTPWLYNPTNKQYISYDDTVSVGVKTQWAIDNGLAGLFCWSVEQDNGELLSAMKPMINGNGPTTTTTLSPTSTTTTTSVPTTMTTTITTSTKTTTTATSTATSGAGCSGVAAYSSSTAYNGGAKVVYNGGLYVANYWTQNQTPSPTAGEWDSWKYVGKC